jgi:hypothetical protein
VNLRAELEESGEKEDLKDTGERAVEEAMVGEAMVEEGVAREGENELDFSDRRYC